MSNWSSSKRETTPEFRRNRLRVHKRDQGCCVRCEEQFSLLTRGASVDHIINQAKGGDDSMDNLALLCSPCHREKTSQEAHGRTGWKPRIDPSSGWPFPDVDIAEIVKERNRTRRF